MLDYLVILLGIRLSSLSVDDIYWSALDDLGTGAGQLLVSINYLVITVGQWSKNGWSQRFIIKQRLGNFSVNEKLFNHSEWAWKDTIWGWFWRRTIQWKHDTGFYLIHLARIVPYRIRVHTNSSVDVAWVIVLPRKEPPSDVVMLWKLKWNWDDQHQLKKATWLSLVVFSTVNLYLGILFVNDCNFSLSNSFVTKINRLDWCRFCE